MARSTVRTAGSRTAAHPSARRPARAGGRQAAQPGMAPLTLVNGGDEFLNAREVRRLRHEARTILPEAETVELDAAQTDRYTFSEAVSPSLLSPASIVVLTHFESCSDSLFEEVIDFLTQSPARLLPSRSDTESRTESGRSSDGRSDEPGSDPSDAGAKQHKTGDVQEGMGIPDDTDPAGSSIVIASRSQGPKGSGLAAKLRGTPAEVITVPALRRDSERQDFARQQFARRGRHILPDALAELVAVMGSRTGELAAMCDQLCDDFDEDPISLATVASVMDDTAETTGFQVADAALAGQTGRAVLLLRQALARGAQPVALVGALSSKLHSLALAAAVQAGTLEEARAGVPGWLLRKLRLQLRGWSSDGLARAFEALAHADETAKGTGGDPQYELERAVELICRKGAL